MEFTIRKGRIEDCESYLKLIQELADYEKAPDEVSITIENLEQEGFGIDAIFGSFTALQGNEVIGMAIYYEKYSTWKGRSLYLEDLIVTEDKRGIGAGKALFEAVMLEAKNRNCGRMEWQVLDWNQPAIDFYKSYGADLDPTWINGRFQKKQLQKFNFSQEI
ncbi:MAG: GNAT family N-acetyltransferase [Vicingaceae bacterium]